MTPETLSGWVSDPAARKRYIEAFEQSDFEAMLNYYKRNYPRESGPSAAAARTAESEDAGADVPRPERSGTPCRRLVRDMEMGGKGSHAGHRAGGRPFRPAGRCRSGNQDDAVVVVNANDPLGAGVATESLRSLAQEGRPVHDYLERRGLLRPGHGEQHKPPAVGPVFSCPRRSGALSYQCMQFR